MNGRGAQVPTWALAGLIVASVAGCASESRDATPARPPSATPTSAASSTLAINARLDQPSVTVRIAAGSRLVAILPANPMGTWTAPKIDGAAVRVTLDRLPIGVELTVIAVAPGRADISLATTPSGDPRPPGRIPTPSWRLTVDVT